MDRGEGGGGFREAYFNSLTAGDAYIRRTCSATEFRKYCTR